MITQEKLFPIPYWVDGDRVYFDPKELRQFLGWPLPMFKSYLRGVTIPGYLSPSGKVYGEIKRFQCFFKSVEEHSTKEPNHRQLVQMDVWKDKIFGVELVVCDEDSREEAWQ